MKVPSAPKIVWKRNGADKYIADIDRRGPAMPS